MSERFGPLGKVVPFPKRLSVRERVEEPLDSPVTAKPRENRCGHKHVELDKQGRLLRCKDCEQVIDPIDWIAQLAVEWDFYVYRWRAANAGIRRAEAELKKLEGRERNAKSRVRRARDWLREHAGETWADLDSDDDLFRA